MTNKQEIFFMAGFPRAGSTLLINILSQNSKFHGTATSGLITSLIQLKEHWKGNENYLSNDEEYIYRKIKTMMKGTLHGFYQDELNKDIIPIDKNRVVLDNVNFYENEVLPVIGTRIPDAEIIIGQKIENVLIEDIFSLRKKFANVDPDFINSISEFYLKDENLIFVNANIGYRIVFGDNEIEEKLKKLIFLEQNRTFEKCTTIDLRFKDKLVIRSEEI